MSVSLSICSSPGSGVANIRPRRVVFKTPEDIPKPTSGGGVLGGGGVRGTAANDATGIKAAAICD